MNDLITILMATYNGEKYISHQLDSIINQTYPNWQLFIRDDGSNDATLDILQHYKERHPYNIQVVKNIGSEKSSLSNFNALLQMAINEKYIMFCDQDDEWKEDKIAITFSQMRKQEEKHGSDYPILVFTNFQYVDENMNIIGSKKDFEVNQIVNIKFPQLLTQNPVYGCTAMINRPLTNKVSFIPPQAENHDYWIALVASIFGSLFYCEEKTVLYRQHGRNLSGAFDNNSTKKRFSRVFIKKDSFKIAERKKVMLLKLRDIYYSMMNDTTKSILDNFIKLYKNKSLFLIYKNIKSGVKAQSYSQTILLYTVLLLYKNKPKSST